jgi:phosphoribosylaminoimidazole-succinocarboxamide synthase
VSPLSLPHRYSGKVRELYDVDADHLLMVASDRLSAFDVVMDEPIADKGRVLTAMTCFWVDEVADIVPGTIEAVAPEDLVKAVPVVADAPEIFGRAMLVRRAEMIPLECIVRARLAGQAFSEYQQFGTVHGEPAPAGMALTDAFATPRFTPSTKEASGHDRNISFNEAIALVGEDLAVRCRDVSLAIFARAAARAADAGFVLADTKFELGLIGDTVVLCDEVCTPDSSRLWRAADIVPGEVPPSYDKQPFRDWLETLDWDKTPPPPPVPAAVAEATAQRYRDAYELVTGRRLADWYGAER